MAINDVFRLHVVMFDGTGNRSLENGFVFQQASEIVQPTEGADLVGSWLAQAKAAYLGLIHTDYSLYKLRVEALPEHLTVYEEAGDGDNATLTGDSLPAYVAGVLTIRTATLGKRGRGRLFLGPPNEASNSASGNPVGAYITAMQALATALEGMADGGVTAADWYWGVWSDADQAFRAETSITAQQQWKLQRGRMPRPV